MLGLAARAFALPTAFLHRRAGSAIGAVAVALMPAHHRFGHRDRRKLVGRHRALHRHAAQFGHGDVVAGQQFFHRRGRNTHSETPLRRRATPKRWCRDWRRISALRRRRAARGDVSFLLHHQRVAVHHIGAGVRALLQRNSFASSARRCAARSRIWVMKAGCPSGNVSNAVMISTQSGPQPDLRRNVLMKF